MEIEHEFEIYVGRYHIRTYQPEWTYLHVRVGWRVLKLAPKILCKHILKSHLIIFNHL